MTEEWRTQTSTNLCHRLRVLAANPDRDKEITMPRHDDFIFNDNAKMGEERWMCRSRCCCSEATGEHALALRWFRDHAGKS